MYDNLNIIFELNVFIDSNYYEKNVLLYLTG